jgi:hypothetical protein
MKALVFLRLSDRVTAGQRGILVDRVLKVVRQAGLRSMINEADDSQATPRWDVVVELWADDEATLQAVPLADLVPPGHATAVRVDELPGKDELHDAARSSGAVKLIVAWTRLHGVTREEARRLWDEHVPLANRIHVGVVRYQRHWMHETPLWGPPLVYTGVAMQVFPEARAMQERMFDGPDGAAAIQADASQFVGTFDTLVTREHPCPARTEGAQT